MIKTCREGSRPQLDEAHRRGSHHGSRDARHERRRSARTLRRGHGTMQIYRLVLQALFLLGLWLGLGMQANAQTDTVTYVYTDLQGTPLVHADAQGNVIARYDYTPYGNPVSSLNGAPDGPGYTGHVYDPESGLVYMQARYYQPDGRFLSPDPAGLRPGDVYGFNRYVYVNNNPIVSVDPTGMQGCSPRQDNNIGASCPSSPKKPPAKSPSPSSAKQQPPVIVTATAIHDSSNSQQIGAVPPIFKIEGERVLFRNNLAKKISRKVDDYISKQIVKKASFKTLTITKEGFLEPTPFAFGLYILMHSPDLGGCDSHGSCSDEAPVPSSGSGKQN